MDVQLELVTLAHFQEAPFLYSVNQKHTTLLLLEKGK